MRIRAVALGHKDGGLWNNDFNGTECPAGPDLITLEGETSLECLQKGVDGYIEHLSGYFPELRDAGYEVWGNDEARLRGMKPTIALVNDFLEEPVAYDCLTGPLIIVRSEESETRSMTLKDLAAVRKWLAKCRVCECRVIGEEDHSRVIPAVHMPFFYGL